MAGDPHREVACVAAAFRPPFPLLVGQPFLAVLRFIFSTALVAAAFRPPFPLFCGIAIPGCAPFFVAQPLLAVRLSPHLASTATPSRPHQAPRHLPSGWFCGTNRSACAERPLPLRGLCGEISLLFGRVAPGFSPAFPRLWHSHSWLCSDLHLLDWAKKRKMKWVASQHPEADAMSCVVRISRESASFAGRSRVFESLLARQNYP